MPSATPPRRRWRPRFSLATLLLLVMLLGSIGVLWMNWDPWVPGATLAQSNGPFVQACFVRDGKRIVALTNNVLRVFDTRTGEFQLEYLSEYDADKPIALSRNGPIGVTSLKVGENVPPYPGEPELRQPLNRKVTVQCIDMPIKDVLKKIESDTGAKIQLCDSVSGDTLINLRVTDMQYHHYLEWVCKLAEAEVDYSEGLIRIRGSQEFYSARENALAIRNVESNVIRLVLPGVKTRVEHAHICASGRILANFDRNNGLLALYDVNTGKCVLDLRNNSIQIAAFTISDDGRYLAAQHFEGRVGIWDLSSGLLIRDVDPGVKFAVVLVLSPDGTYLLSQERIWNTQLGTSVPLLETAGQKCTPQTQFHPAGHRLAVRLHDTKNNDHDIVVFDCTSGKPVWRVNGTGIERFAFSPDGSVFLLAGYGDRMELRDANDGTVLCEFPPRKFVWRKAEPSMFSPFAAVPRNFEGDPKTRFSPDGASLLVGEEKLTLWHRRRPERWWGAAWLWEFWVVLAFGAALARSVVRDRRSMRRI